VSAGPGTVGDSPPAAQSVLRPAGEGSVPLKRFPGRKEVWTVFLIAVIPAHVQAILIFLYVLPGLLLRLEGWDIAGVFSYVLAGALLESILLLVLAMTAGLLMPKRVFREKIISASSGFIILTQLWLFVSAYMDPGNYPRGGILWVLFGVYQPEPGWYVYLFIQAVFLTTLSIWHSFRKGIERLAAGLLPLGKAYLAMDVVGLVLIVFRLIG